MAMNSLSVLGGNFATKGELDLAGGLVLVSPTSIANSGGSASASGGAVTFTGVSSVSLNGVFTSAYDNYLVIITGTGSTSALDVAIRFRSSGTDDTGSNYSWQYVRASGTTISGARASAFGDNIYIGALDSGGLSSLNINIFSPALTTGKTVIGQSVLAGTLSTPEIRNHSGGSKNTSSFDGLTFLNPGGNSTGTIRVYGYRNS